ncbi:MAG: hypothetical protein ABI162_15325, partial [Luteolibacter sp.]
IGANVGRDGLSEPSGALGNGLTFLENGAGNGVGGMAERNVSAEMDNKAFSPKQTLVHGKDRVFLDAGAIRYSLSVPQTRTPPERRNP